MRIIPRAEWGARHPRGFRAAPLPADEVWLHHSVTLAPDLVPPYDDDFAAVRTLERIGQDRFGGGISYTFAVTPAGLIFEGHGVDRQGAHTANHNVRGRGIVLVGDYERNRPTPQMVDAVAWLLRHGHERGWWKAPRLNGGHRDTKATVCPGRHGYASIAEINRRAATAPPAQEETNVALTPEQDNAVMSTWIATFFGGGDAGPKSIIKRLEDIEAEVKHLGVNIQNEVAAAVAAALADLRITLTVKGN